MRASPIFTPELTDVQALIRDFPLGLLVTTGSGGSDVSPLPILLDVDASGEWRVHGHFARANPQIEDLEREPHASLIFLGPHGYISPSWFTDRTQAPTWNFALVKLEIEVEIDRSAEAARDAVDRLTTHMERGRPNAWSAREMGERYERLVPGVVAFQAKVLSIQAKFKLGQNERMDVLTEILAATAAQPELRSAMQKANRSRLRESAAGTVAS